MIRIIKEYDESIVVTSSDSVTWLELARRNYFVFIFWGETIYYHMWFEAGKISQNGDDKSEEIILGEINFLAIPFLF